MLERSVSFGCHLLPQSRKSPNEPVLAIVPQARKIFRSTPKETGSRLRV